METLIQEWKMKREKNEKALKGWFGENVEQLLNGGCYWQSGEWMISIDMNGEVYKRKIGSKGKDWTYVGKVEYWD